MMLSNLSILSRTASSSSSKVFSRCASNEATASVATTHYRVTLRRSAIGLPEKRKKFIANLGLKKRLSSVYLPQNPSVASNILAVKELLHVDNVRRLDHDEVQLAKTSDYPEETLSTLPSNEEAIWINDKGEVVDWGGKKARKAPRGYSLVGNLINEARHEEIMTKRRQQAAKAAKADAISNV